MNSLRRTGIRHFDCYQPGGSYRSILEFREYPHHRADWRATGKLEGQSDRRSDRRATGKLQVMAQSDRPIGPEGYRKVGDSPADRPEGYRKVGDGPADRPEGYRKVGDGPADRPEHQINSKNSIFKQ